MGHFLGMCNVVYLLGAVRNGGRASGASEGTFYLAFSPLFGDYLTTAMLIWRLASYYLTIVLGYIAVVAERITLRHAQQ